RGGKRLELPLLANRLPLPQSLLDDGGRHSLSVERSHRRRGVARRNHAAALPGSLAAWHSRPSAAEAVRAAVRLTRRRCAMTLQEQQDVQYKCPFCKGKFESTQELHDHPC